MIVQQRDVRGGIAAVLSAYYGSRLETDYDVLYIESYCDGSKLQKLIKAVCAYCSFVYSLLHNRPDLVHIHSSFGPSFYRKLPFIALSSFAGIPIVNHIHGADFDSFYTRSPHWKKVLIRKVYAQCAELIVLSDTWRALFSRIYPKDRITVIHNYGIPIPEAELQELALKRFSMKQVLFLGEICKRKGGDDLPEIIKHVLRIIPDVVFVIAGTGDIQRIQDALSPEALSHVVFPGWLRNASKDSALRQSAVFLLPSYQEGMPMAILDAMSYGLPIVSTTVGGIPELVNDINTGNGVLLQPGDTNGLSKAICRYLTDYGVWQTASASSVHRLREQFSLDQHIVLLEQVYERNLI